MPWFDRATDLHQMLWIAEVGFAGSAVALGLAIAVYVVGSFVLMMTHTQRRPFAVAFRELVREAFFATLTQPLLPVFYLVGHRMDRFVLARRKDGLVREGAQTHTPVVFVHGYMQNRVDFLGLARALHREGIGPLFGFNYPWFASLTSNAARLDRYIARVCKETGATAVDLVCHSMGGLVAMEMMRSEAWKDTLKVRRCVTIATPHAGVAWGGPIIGVGGAGLRRGSKLLEAHAGFTISVPALSVYSTHDNVVHPQETSSLVKRGGRDVVVEGLAHLSLLFSPDVAKHVASFLAEPL